MGAIERLRLVAHRGYPAAFPENTLVGYQQAALHGARYVETDVQCTRDGVPILYHDATTRRLCGVDGRITERTLHQLAALSAHHPERFGDRFRGTPIPTLQEFAGWLHGHPSVTAFVEIKRQTLRLFGAERVLANVMQALEAVTSRCVIISFDDQCLAHAKRRYAARTGWVLKSWDGSLEARARALAPEYLFVNREGVPADAAAPGGDPWEWGVDVVNDLFQALSWVDRGFPLVETDAIGDLLDAYRAGPAQ